MPPASSATPGPRLTRRAALGVVAAGALAACTPPERGVDRRREQPPEPVEPEVDPDVAVAAEALAAQQAMVDLVGTTLERHPDLAAELDPVLATHRTHADLLADAVPEDVTVSPSPTASGSAGPSGSVTPERSAAPGPSESAARRNRVPDDRLRALRQVVAGEQALVTTAKQQAFKAQSGGFARVLGGMAAAAAQHAAMLDAAARGGVSGGGENGGPGDAAGGTS